MSHLRIQELAMKIVDTDATLSDRPSGGIDVSSDADTHASPGLRPEVLVDAAQRQTKAMVHAALFKKTGEAPTIGPYQVLKSLGQGGMGVVYAAYDDKLERKVALKLIRGAAMRGPDGRARTLREARALARLSHPNVVHVYQVGEVDDEIYVAMEFLTGPTLRAWLAAKPRTWREVLAVFRQAGEGLAAAHRQGVIHRDFKPANVIVGDDGRVRVLDFGLAHFGEEGEVNALPPAGEITDVLLTQTGAVLGTPAYMAAEQFAGARGDAKTDQFSFCTALYEALYGQRPFDGEQLDALASAVKDGRMRPVKARHDVPQWLHRVVVRGLQPDPASRWPSMDALLVALSPPEARVRWGRLAVAAGSASALLLGGVTYAFMQESLPPPWPPPPLAGQADPDEAAARGRAAMTRAHDATLLLEARAALTVDPMQTIRTLSRLAGDDASTWEQARFLVNAAEVRGLPSQVLRAGDRPLADVWPLVGGGVIGRDDLGAVWQWDTVEKSGKQLLPAGSATEMVVARDVPVWAAITDRAVQVFGADRAQTIDLDGAVYSLWGLASDGGTLMAMTTTPPTATTGWRVTIFRWDLTRPGSPPQTTSQEEHSMAYIADDASIFVTAAKGIRHVRPRATAETLLKHRGSPRVLSADGRFLLVVPDDKQGVIDVLEIETGKSRQVKAEAVTVLAGSDVLFTRMDYGRPFVRRESLATGAIAWQLPLGSQAGPHESKLVVDPANEQFAVAMGEAWGVGDLRRGVLTSFVTVPKGSSPKWVGPGALMVSTGNEVRIYRPAASPVQVHHEGWGCGLSPAGRWAIVVPYDLEDGEFTRVDLATKATTKFRCPDRPKTEDRGGRYRSANLSAVVDDAGQVAMFSLEGWSCWWDEQHGARTGARTFSWGQLAGLPRGAALAEGAEVEVWSGPEDRAQRWTAAGPVADMIPSPSGASLAVRSDRGVQVLRVDTGAAMSVPIWAPPSSKAEIMASAMAWSPDSARLAVLDKVGASLELSVWDVAGEPREIGPANYVAPGGHVLEDSPGRPRNRMAFTPAGTAVALTHRHESLMLVDLATYATRQLAVPELLDLRMRSETDAIGVDFEYAPVMIDFAAGEVSPLTPNPEIGGSTAPPIRRSEDGSVWTCSALGPGTLIEVAPRDESSPQELRNRLVDLVVYL